MFLPTSTVAELESLTCRAIEKRIKSGVYPAAQVRETPGRGGDRGKQYEIDLDALSDKARQKYLDQLGRQTALALPPTTQEEDAETLASLAPWQRKAALERRKAVLAFRAYKQQGKAADWLQAQTVVRATIYNWDHAYGVGGRNGLLALAPKKPERESQHLTEGMKAVIEQYYLTHARRKIHTVCKRIKEHCQQTGTAIPSERIINYYIQKTYPPSVQAFFRAGEGQWRRIFEPIVHRDYSSLPVNGIYCGDQRLMDTLLIIPTASKATFKRPWLSMWIDVKSATIVGYHLSFESDAYMIALALRRAFLRFGLPQCVYMDNGKQYRSVYLQGARFVEDQKLRTWQYNKETEFVLSAHDIIYEMGIEERGILDTLDIDVRHSIPVNSQSPGAIGGGVARAKPIEPLFNIFHELEQELPGWCGHNTQEVPEKLKREVRAGALLTLDQYRTHVERWIDEQNHQKHGWRTQPSLDFYRDFQAVFAPKRDLDLLMRPKKMATVKYCEVNLTSQARSFGVELLHGLWYSSPELAEWSGQKVIIWYDPLDLSSAVITGSGAHPQFICEIQKTDLMGWQASANDYKEHVMKPRKEARAAMKAYQQHRDVLETGAENLLVASKRRNVETGRRPVSTADVITLTPISPLASDLQEYRNNRQLAANAEPPGAGTLIALPLPRQPEAAPELSLADIYQPRIVVEDEDEAQGFADLYTPRHVKEDD